MGLPVFLVLYLACGRVAAVSNVNDVHSVYTVHLAESMGLPLDHHQVQCDPLWLTVVRYVDLPDAWTDITAVTFERREVFHTCGCFP